MPSESPELRLSWRQAIAWRMGRHHLDRRVPSSQTLAVASRLCGVHAQLLSSAELALWARVEGLEPGAVGAALWDERTLVKTWAMRGTLHLLPAADYPVWQAALSTYQHYLKPAWFKAFGVTRQELETLLAAVGEALGGGEPLTREELAGAVTRSTGSADLGEKVLGSWGPFLKPASFRGHLCFGPSLGQNVRFTRPDRWLGPWEPVDPDEANLQVARWYLGAHGPASREDYARWWAMSPAQALKILRRLGDEVTPVNVDGYQAWMLKADAAEAAKAKPAKSVRLLPAFDQYVIAATRHTAHLLPEQTRAGVLEKLIYRPQGWLSPVLVVNGAMAGVWKHERKGGRLDVAIEPFGAVSAAVRRGVDEEAERLRAYLGGKLSVSWPS